MKFKELSAGPANLIKLKNGESARGVFRGEIYDFKQHWEDGFSAPCSGDGCKNCEVGNKPSFRFRVNFLTQENGAWTAKVFEQGRRVYGTMKALNEGDYPLDKHAMKITRYGTGKDDTTYSITPVPNGQLSKEMEKALAMIKLNDLHHNLVGEDD